MRSRGSFSSVCHAGVVTVLILVRPNTQSESQDEVFTLLNWVSRSRNLWHTCVHDVCLSQR